MSVDVASLSLEDALSMALTAEIESAELYDKLKKSVSNFVLKDKLQFLIEEEKKHKAILETLFKKMFPGKKPALDKKSIVPGVKIAIEKESSVLDLLEVALEVEKVFEDFYQDLSEEVEHRGTQEILLYLSTMEHGHYALLRGEYDLCSRDEDYYARGDFQYDMVHNGP